MKNIIKDTVRKIKLGGITPSPRWKYLVKKYALWCAFLAVILLGAISFSVTLTTLTQLDWDLYRFINQNPFVYSLSLLPYFWLILIGIFLFLAFFDLRKTENGYRFSWLKMSLLTIGSILFFGFLFSLTGLAGNFNSALVKNVPYYGHHMATTKESQWTQPELGFLSGKIATVSKNNLNLIDLKNNSWNIILNEETVIRPSATIATGEIIKIIGTQKDSHNFEATEIRPWMGQGMMKSLGGNQAMMNSSSRNLDTKQAGRGGHGMMGK